MTSRAILARRLVGGTLNYRSKIFAIGVKDKDIGLVTVMEGLGIIHILIAGDMAQGAKQKEYYP